MFGGLLVTGLHVEEGEVGVNELFGRPKFLRLVALGDGAGKVALAVVGAAEGKLGIEVGGVLREDGGELLDGPIELAHAELQHGIVVSVLERLHGWIVGRDAPDVHRTQ